MARHPSVGVCVTQTWGDEDLRPGTGLCLCPETERTVQRTIVVSPGRGQESERVGGSLGQARARGGR